MAAVLANAVRQRIGWPGDDLVLTLGADRIVLAGDEIRDHAQRRAGPRPLALRRTETQSRARLAALAAQRHRESQRELGRPVRANEATIRRLSAFTNAVDRMWPGFTAEELLRNLFGTQAWLVRAADGLLTADERAALYRPMADSVATEPWTEADLFCLDEVATLLNRDVVTYGHLVVDEAQDLSPMQARALARRCPSGSFTVLGDLAQTTGPWVRDDLGRADRSTSAQRRAAGARADDRLPRACSRARAARPRSCRSPAHGSPPPRSIRTGLGEPAGGQVLGRAMAEAVASQRTGAMSTRG